MLLFIYFTFSPSDSHSNTVDMGSRRKKKKKNSISDLCYCLKHLHTRGCRDVQIKPVGILPGVEENRVTDKSQTEALQTTVIFICRHSDTAVLMFGVQNSSVFRVSMKVYTPGQKWTKLLGLSTSWGTAVRWWKEIEVHSGRPPRRS